MKDGARPRVFRNGEHKRDFVYVKDVVTLTIKALRSPKNNIYNCGSGHPVSFNEVIEELNKNLGTDLKPEYIDNPYAFYQPHTEARMLLARQELGFEPAFTPITGIADYVKILEGGE